MTLKWVRGVVCCWGAALVIVISAQANQHGDESGFTPLFNGKDLTGWVYGGSQDRPDRQGKGYQVDYRKVRKSAADLEQMLVHSRKRREVPVIVDGGEVTIGYGGT